MPFERYNINQGQSDTTLVHPYDEKEMGIPDPELIKTKEDELNIQREKLINLTLKEKTTVVEEEMEEVKGIIEAKEKELENLKNPAN